jgi:hypothetical protein
LNKKIEDELEEIFIRKIPKDAGKYQNIQVTPGSMRPDGAMEPLPFNMCDLDNEFCPWKRNCHHCGKGVANGR